MCECVRVHERVSVCSQVADLLLQGSSLPCPLRARERPSSSVCLEQARALAQSGLREYRGNQ